MTSYVSIVEENTEGDLTITFPVELLAQMGWTEDTIVEWELDGDEVIIKEKVDE